MNKSRKDNSGSWFIGIIILFVIIRVLYPVFNDDYENNHHYGYRESNNYIRILSSPDNKYVEEKLKTYAVTHDVDIEMKYMGDLEIVDELDRNSKEYDAVWISNSMWLYMLDNSYLTSESKSISVSPVVFGIRESKAKSLGLYDKQVTNNEIISLINNKKLNYVMSSVTATNTGATAYFGFINALAGNPEVLTSEILQNKKLHSDLKNLFSGVERVSGDEDYLTKMFLNSNDYEALIADESTLININKSLKKDNKETLYLLYPTDGVALNDSTFAFIDNNLDKKENFLKLQSYLLSDEGQKMLMNQGRRTWYGGVNKNAPKDIFNPSWGIDTTKYLNVTKFPSKNIMNEAIDLYIEKLRKPTHVVFCLDYSGSMYGTGISELRSAMSYILNDEEARKDKLQFSEFDKITVIKFSSDVDEIWTSNNGHETSDLIKKINNTEPGGNTALYPAVQKALEILEEESDEYTKTVIAMTDGAANVGSYSMLSNEYYRLKKKVPVYSITFGSADERQLVDIASLTNAKVFDGRSDLLGAFKEVRGYN